MLADDLLRQPGKAGAFFRRNATHDRLRLLRGKTQRSGAASQRCDRTLRIRSKLSLQTVAAHCETDQRLEGEEIVQLDAGVFVKSLIVAGEGICGLEGISGGALVPPVHQIVSYCQHLLGPLDLCRQV